MDRTTLINFEGLRGRFGLVISRDTLRQHCKTGRFPAPFSIGRRIFWKVNEIERFLSAQKPRRQRLPKE